MGIISSGVKRLGRAVAKKAKPKAKPVVKMAKKPMTKAQKEQLIIETAIGVPLVGASAVLNVEQTRRLNENRARAEQERARREQELASARGKPGNKAIGADKFSWAGRR